ncbi:Nitrous oxide reductase maturation transmembrane protein NosY [hydrothermal vent metagenome]|uniref:Nitrous oxide reductase maturation transmembrane protein NosY n=1 Tax=hydrothermal vent metagenome TaxID=652676 RepID=A0A3B0UHA6_9ZZZZ
MKILTVARLELVVSRRNMWVATSVFIMALFSVVLTLAGGATANNLGVDPLSVAMTSITTLSVYLVPLIALLLSFDAIAGELERGTLALNLAYPISRGEILLGKFLAHFLVLAFAIAVGLVLSGLLVIWRHGLADISFAPMLILYVTALPLGATFLGIGYLISTLARQPGVASGLVIIAWLVLVVLYDLGLLGALVADEGGYFTSTIFPVLLLANPADAFRLLNMPEISVTALASGLNAIGPGVDKTGLLISLLGWPILALFLAWIAFEKVEP